MIYVIGDSHVSMFRGDSLISPTGDEWYPSPARDDVRICHLGPVTIRSLDGTDPGPGKINYLEKIKQKLAGPENSPNATFVFMFGEIDIRCRILRNLSVTLGEDPNRGLREPTARTEILARDLCSWLFPMFEQKIKGHWFYVIPFASPIERTGLESGDYQVAGPARERRLMANRLSTAIMHYGARLAPHLVRLDGLLTSSGLGAFLPDQIHLAGTKPMEYILEKIALRSEVYLKM